MRRSFAEGLVALIVVVWLLAVAVALLDPERGEVAGTLAPVIGLIAGAAIAVLKISRDGKNGA